MRHLSLVSILFGSALLVASAPVAAQSGTLRPFRSNREFTDYLHHIAWAADSARRVADSIQSAKCGAATVVSRKFGNTTGALSLGDAVIRVQVRSAEGNAPLIGASVTVDKRPLGTITRDDGIAELKIPAALLSSPAAVRVDGRLIGYKLKSVSLTIARGDSIAIEFAMCSNPLRLSEIVVTGEGMTSSVEKLESPNALSDQITNTQTSGVDEGDIVKLDGNYLVVLRRGRLFTIDLGTSKSKHTLAPRAMINAYGDGIDPSGTWYDELMVHADRVLVIGYSYQRRGTEIGLFKLGADGSLRYQGTYQLRSHDYYSGRNYASRLVGDKLVFYSPLSVNTMTRDAASVLPALREWNPRATDADFRPIAVAEHIYRSPVDPLVSSSIALHTVTSCDLASAEFTCASDVVVGPSGRVFYVSQTAVYVWASQPGSSGDTTLAMSAGSTLFRLPLDGEAPTAIRVAGSPVDQLSFQEDADGHLNVLVRAGGNGDAMWWGEQGTRGTTALLRLSLSDFGDGRRVAGRSQYRVLPTIGEGNFQNRFVGEWLLYGSGNTWGAQGASSSTLFAVRTFGGDPVRVELSHSVDRIEALGANAVVVGSNGSALHFSGIDLSNDPVLAQHFELADAAQGELRTHGFFYRQEDESNGVLALPVRGSGGPAWSQLFTGSASVLYLRNAKGQFAQLGALTSHAGAQNAATSDACAASCVDWYGNARPIFIRGRVFALLGYEMVEGRERGGRLLEEQRVDFAPKLVLDARR